MPKCIVIRLQNSFDRVCAINTCKSMSEPQQDAHLVARHSSVFANNTVPHICQSVKKNETLKNKTWINMNDSNSFNRHSFNKWLDFVL